MGILRKIKRIVISRNHGNNTVDTISSSDEIHNLSDIDGSLESLYMEEACNQACGCFAPPGGRCRECGAISCIRCHRHCGGSDGSSPLGCGKPICREHSYFLTLPDGSTSPFCRSCYGKLVRKGRWRLAVRVLLEPFVEQEDQQ